MNPVINVVRKVHRFFKLDPSLSRKNRDEIQDLKATVLNGKKKDLRKIKKANGSIRLLIEKGEIHFKMLKK